MLGSKFFTVITTVFALSLATTPALAKKGKGPKKSKFMRAEAVPKKDSSSINFNEVDISGEAKAPALDMVTVNNGRSDYGFIKIRLNWNNEMINTASNLDRQK